jgi:CHAT domain-containing protein
LVIDATHGPSISRRRGTPQPRLWGRPAGRRLIAAIVLAGWALPGLAAGASCTGALGAPAIANGPLKTHGIEPAEVQLPVVPGRTYLIEVDERGKDAVVEVLDSKTQAIARADHPERRTGTRRAVLMAPEASLVVRVTGKEQAGAVGTAEVRIFDLAALRERPDCLGAVTDLAEADYDYARAEDIAAGRSNSPNPRARDAFLQAAAEYAAAERALNNPADQGLRGEAALALAGVEYFDLQDWAKAAQWAEAAAGELASDDPYRRARADTLLATAWMEIGSTASSGRPIEPYGVSSTELLVRARNLLEQLRRFHLTRGERYDTAVQLTNIGLTYFEEGRFRECITASATSSRLFGAIHETVRRAQAWQNQALCLWGLGRLPEALRRFERSLRDISPEAYPTIYLASITNTALADFAVGRFDDSLRIYGRALAFTRRIQSQREEAYCLYGIGVNYYALGDREKARENLERSLKIRTVAVDGRGRLASLRALATVDAEQGRVKEALAFDQEALSLAVAPSVIARIQIQLAAHTAVVGHPTEAKALLDGVISRGVTDNPAIKAEALLQRAILLRQMGRPRKALADLAAARPRLHAFGQVIEEFEADLERARALQLTGQSEPALEAVERALGHSDAVRLQTANPELRAQLQTPLRPAYDLELELLRAKYDRAVAAGRERDANEVAVAAFRTADSARAHSFADVAAQRYPPEVLRALASELRRREALYRELAFRRFALDTHLDRSGSEDPQSQHLIADIGELEREVDTINTLIATRTMTAGAAVPVTEGPDIPLLPAGAALISYWLGSESAYAWVVLPGEIHWVRLSSPVAIATRAAAFHRSLTRLVDIPAERRLQDARALYGMIVRPLEPWLSDVKRWIIVPDGALDYVPLAALQTPDNAGSFVVQRHDIALTPAAWALRASGTRESPHARRALLLVADPVYQAEDPRLAAARGSRAPPRSAVQRSLDGSRREYRRLPFTGQEAAQISAQFAPADVDQLIGLDATRDRLLSLDWSAYRFIHIATHGVVDAQVPQLSALILGSYDARGEVADNAVRVADVSLQTLTADVVVLSACDTALGKQIRSEGLVGLASTMLARGARAVVASLWPVSDEIGARLMTEFYRHLLWDSMRPETALGTAMRSLLARDPSADPALWAAFQVSVASLGPSQPSGVPAQEVAATTMP